MTNKTVSTFSPPGYALVLRLFNDGYDTLDIALAYRVHESVVWNILARGDQS